MAKKASRGRPKKSALECMVPMSASIPAKLRDRIDRIVDRRGETRSSVVTELLTDGIKGKR